MIAGLRVSDGASTLGLSITASQRRPMLGFPGFLALCCRLQVWRSSCSQGFHLNASSMESAAQTYRSIAYCRISGFITGRLAAVIALHPPCCDDPFNVRIICISSHYLWNALLTGSGMPFQGSVCK